VTRRHANALASLARDDGVAHLAVDRVHGHAAAALDTLARRVYNNSERRSQIRRKTGVKVAWRPFGSPTIDARHERFGVRTVKGHVASVDEVRALMSFARSSGAIPDRALPAEQMIVAQALESAGCRLMDVLVYYARDLHKAPIPDDIGSVLVRSIRPDDTEIVATIARESFKGYIGHYHADPRLDRTQCDEVYASWARRACLSREVADEVLIAEEGGTPLGFFTLRMENSEKALSDWLA
jgi:hypothetical protein